jgi:hypothetical protein
MRRTLLEHPYLAIALFGLGLGCSSSDGGATCSEQNRCLTTLVSGQDLTGFAVDDGTVYWIDENASGEGTVNKEPVNGGSVVTLAAGRDFPMGLAVDAANVYWMDWNLASNGYGDVMKVPRSGGMPTAIATELGDPSFLAVNASGAYFTTPATSVLWKVPLGGGAPVDTGLSVNGGFVVDAATFYWVAIGPHGYEGSVLKAPLTGGTVTTLATWQGAPGAIAVDATNVYWTGTALDSPFVPQDTLPPCPAGSACPVPALPPSPPQPSMTVVKEVPLGGGSATTLASAHGVGANLSLAVDGTSVFYWASDKAGDLRKVPIGGGLVTTVATGVSDSGTLAVDGTSVYWATSSRVMKLTPK